MRITFTNARATIIYIYILIIGYYSDQQTTILLLEGPYKGTNCTLGEQNIPTMIMHNT